MKWIQTPFHYNEIFEINGKRFIVIDYEKPVSYKEWSAMYLIEDEYGKQYNVPFFHLMIQYQRGLAKYKGTKK